MDQEEKVTRLTVPTNEKDFASKREMAQYIGVNCRPDICAAIQLIAPGGESLKNSEYATIRKVIDHLQSDPPFGLTFVPIYLSTSRLVLFSDASFGNARKEKSQLAYVVILADKDDHENIIHYASTRCRRITRSVMASEIHALVLGFVATFSIQHLITRITGRRPTIEAYVDSKTVFDVIAKQGRTSEKRLQIDISCLRESYEKGELQR